MANRYFIISFLVIVLLASSLRLNDLASRPLHVDEAVQTYKTGTLLAAGLYHYDPVEFHGPTLYYFSLPVFWISHVKTYAASLEWQYRIVPAMFGIGAVLLLLMLRDVLGTSATLFAGLFTAISPMLVFYSQYYIHETLLVFFTLLFVAALWRARSATRFSKAYYGYYLFAGAALGLMHATKETFVIAVACFGAGLAVSSFRMRRATKGDRDLATQYAETFRANLPAIFFFSVAAAVVSLIFYSSFFTHMRGILDSILAFTGYFQRAGGDGSSGMHRNSWYFYLQRLLWWRAAPGPVWSEGLIFAGAFLSLFTLKKTPADQATKFRQVLVIYALLMTCIYSTIPYKTPWTFLGAWHALILASALGWSFLIELVSNRAGRSMLCALLLLFSIQLGFQTWRTTHRYSADPRNPYVYAHTASGFMQLVRRLEQLGEVAPEGKGTTIQVVSADYWPLPFYLRAWSHVGFYAALPEKLNAPLVLALPAQGEQIEPLLPGYSTEFYALRPNVLLTLYIAPDLFQALLNKNKQP